MCQVSRRFSVSFKSSTRLMMFYKGTKVTWLLLGPLRLYIDSSCHVWLLLTLHQGILYLLSPVTFTLLTRYPRLQAYCCPAGLVITVLGSLLSSFSKKIWHLIATQGVMCAIGNGLLFSPASLYLDQWFIRKKGLALGIMWAAKSVTGVTLPFVASSCLSRFGSSTTLRAWTVVTVCYLASMYLSDPHE